MPRLIFSYGDYAFYRDDFSFWNATRKGDVAPLYCAYASPAAIAKLKGLDPAAIAAMDLLQWSVLPV